MMTGVEIRRIVASPGRPRAGKRDAAVLRVTQSPLAGGLRDGQPAGFVTGMQLTHTV
jgi:hypothetical protein